MSCIGGLLDITTGSVILTASEVKEVESYIDQIIAENAKLRELVQRMRRYMVGAIEHCGYDAQTTGYTMLGSRLEECEDAMRELGMELDG